LKLLDKYSRLNITATILTFVIGSLTFYFLLNYILVRELDERLQAEQDEVTAYVRTHNALPDVVKTKDQYTTYEPAISAAKTEFQTRKDTGREAENIREIHFTTAVAGRYYMVTVGTPLEETEALQKVIIIVTLAMVAAILLIGFLINRVVIRRLWQPFYTTIERVQQYSITEQQAPAAAPTDIDEFALLNRTIQEMMERIQQDYHSLKKFTGQAAHEMQTPLAIIRMRLDALLQQEELAEKSAVNIAEIEQAVSRLSRLHQSLLLLTKVENRQFVLNEPVSLDKIVADKCAEYVDIAMAKGITIRTDIQPLQLQFHQQLAEITVSNLLSNAVKYNQPGGQVELVLHGSLRVSNTSDRPALDGARLFKRFYRDSVATEGTGLGLSLVKQICDLAGYTITYEFANGRHDFIINFRDNISDFLQN